MAGSKPPNSNLLKFLIVLQAPEAKARQQTFAEEHSHLNHSIQMHS